MKVVDASCPVKTAPRSLRNAQEMEGQGRDGQWASSAACSCSPEAPWPCLPTYPPPPTCPAGHLQTLEAGEKQLLRCPTRGQGWLVEEQRRTGVKKILALCLVSCVASGQVNCSGSQFSLLHNYSNNTYFTGWLL